MLIQNKPSLSKAVPRLFESSFSGVRAEATSTEATSKDITLRIVSISSVYPTLASPHRGLFVRARLQSLGQLTSVTVVAPVSWRDRRSPASRIDGVCQVLHPRWAYVPGCGVLAILPLFLRLWSAVIKLHRNGRLQMLDGHFGYPDGIATALMGTVMKIPFSVTLRGSELVHGRYPLRRWFMAWSFRKATRVIAVSGELAQFALSLGVPAANVVTISNGISSSMFHPRDPHRARARFGIPVSDPLIVTAGHLTELKGHHRVILALKILQQRGLPVRMLIAGTSPGQGVPGYEQQLRRLVTELGLEGAVQFLGEVDQETLAELFSAATVFCLASSREGCPNVVLEAQACGAPIVATRVGAIPDLIPANHLGLVVPPKDDVALQEALAAALNTKWDRDVIAQWGQSRSWEQVAQEVLTELRQAVQDPPVRL
ncbi:MAG TPA: glycosyltransferase [Bryobacteraceae bacterium]|nr:glycosyltransferase [Bryobacteraceae bacterium]